MIEKSYNVTVGEVLHNLRVLCDGYEKVIAGENFQCRADAAAVTVKAAAALICQLPCWIPVAERLPEVGQRILGLWMSHRGAVQSVRGAVGGWLDDDGAVTTPPTHWMPLPPPPEETP